MAGSLQRSDIARLIPHSGRMCLLDSVACFSAEEILCTSRSHRDPNNPLREGKELPVLALVEYAAQAAAVHAALVGAGIGDERIAFLGAVKNIAFYTCGVSSDIAQLRITAATLLQTADGAIYRFTVEGDGAELASGRLLLSIPQAQNPGSGLYGGTMLT